MTFYTSFSGNILGSNKPEPNLPDKVRYHFDDPLAVPKLAQGFCDYLNYYCVTGLEPIVIVGIGTDRSTGDCLGPLVGSKLKELSKNSFHIMGTLDEPVHAVNLEEKVSMLKTKYKDAFVIAIDACLGKVDSIGMITLAPGAVKPGAGVQKTLPEVGHVHFTGIVNVGGYMEFMVLQNTRLSVVMKLAQNIASAIYYGYHKYRIGKNK